MNIIVMKSIRLFAVSLLCVLSLPLYAADGDVFTAKTTEDVDMTFKVISAADKTCQVGDGKRAITQDANGAITIPSNANGYLVTSIGNEAFYYCQALASIIIPNSVTSIGEWAFYGCSGLTSIAIPNSVTSIGDYALGYCNGLTSITVDSENKVYDSRDNCNAIIESATNTLIAGCKNTVIPNSVTSIGNCAIYICGGLTSIDIPNSVTSIGDYAFEGCSGLTSINIPNSVTSIGSGAFGGCSGLTSITVDSENKVYDSHDNCNAIIESATNTLIAGCKNTTIPNSVTSIGNAVFEHCSGLTSIDIPNSVISIGDYAFYECRSLTSIDIPYSVTSIGDYAFEGCSGLTSIVSYITDPFTITEDVFDSLTKTSATLHVPYGTKTLYEQTDGWKEFVNIVEITYKDGDIFTAKTIEGIDMTFKVISAADKTCQVGEGEYDKPAIDKTTKGAITIPSNANGYSVTSSGFCAFRGCNVTSIDIPYSVTSIGDYAFSGCINLTSITIPSSVTSIGDYAFFDCFSLTSIAIPNSVTSIGDYAFNGYRSLTSIIVDSENKVYDSHDNCNAIIESATNTLITGCKNTIIPNSVTTIGSHAFYGCIDLTSIDIPNSVTNIGSSAFEHCSSLTSITIPNSVTSIGDYAFSDCSGLTSIFSYIKEPFTITDDIFDSSTKTKATLSVPYGKKLLYEQTDGWKKFTNIVEREPMDVGDVFTAKTEENIDMKFMITDAESKTCQVVNETAIDKGVKGVLTIPDVVNGYIVTEIGSSAFEGCEDLTSIFIPSMVTKIGNAAFEGCHNLSGMVVDSENKIYDSHDNCNAIIETATNTLLFGCMSTVIPATVTAIGERAFYGVTGLTNVTLPAGLKSVGAEAFTNADDLTVVTSEITEPFAIPATAFLHSDGETPTLYVPWDSKEMYLATDGWSQFKTIREIAPENGTIFAVEANGVTLTFKVTDSENYVCQLGSGEQTASSNNAKYVTVPNEVRGLTVTTIGDNAFANCSELLYISFPESIETVGEHVLDGCNSLAVIHWNAAKVMPTSLTKGISNPNLLLYIKQADYAPTDIQNVVVNGEAENIVLKETDGGNNFYCPEAFTAKKVIYEHKYGMTSGYKECRGWETIVLPFDVTSITSETGANVVPREAWSPDNTQQKPFFLYELTSNGWQAAPNIKANTPYIICMPNNENYDPAYQLKGTFEFRGTNVQILPSDELTAVTCNNKRFEPNFQNQTASQNILALNVKNQWSEITADYAEGSVFIRGLRQVRPFEAYMTVEGAAAPEIIPVFEDGMATDIETIKNVYNLNGQRVNTMSSGIYIRNGRKVVVK